MKIICVNRVVKKKQNNSANKQKLKTKQIQKIISNETDQNTEQPYNKTTFQINVMMIFIINKIYIDQNVFDIFILKNIAATKTCLRFMSAFNRNKNVFAT